MDLQLAAEGICCSGLAAIHSHKQVSLAAYRQRCYVIICEHPELPKVSIQGRHTAF